MPRRSTRRRRPARDAAAGWSWPAPAAPGARAARPRGSTDRRCRTSAPRRVAQHFGQARGLRGKAVVVFHAMAAGAALARAQLGAADQLPQALAPFLVVGGEEDVVAV